MARTAQPSNPTWTNPQAYALAAFCLLLGVALGYLFRGSASPDVNAASAATTASAPQGANPHGDPAQMKAMLDQAAAPFLEAIQKNPNDFDSTVSLGNVYYDGHEYPKAIQYYELALKIQPANPDVITDLGTAYWYTGNADKAIDMFNRSLKIRPNHAGTLFNQGVVEWQGKMNPAAAIAAWEQLLRTNPDYPQKQQIEDFIAKAKQHMKGTGAPS